MSDIEQVMLGHDEFESVYTRTGGDDEIGVVQITPVDWQYRRSVKAIIEELEQVTDTFPGLKSNTNFQTQGPLLSMIWRLKFQLALLTISIKPLSK